MPQEAVIREGMRGRARPDHVAMAVLALALSLGFHVFVLQRLPPLQFARPSTPGQSVHYQPMHLDEVIRSRTEAARRPEIFRPENPHQMTDIFGSPEAEGEISKAAFPAPQAPDISVRNIAGEDGALFEAALNREKVSWDPRQEIIQVEKKVYADEVSALPRRYAEAVPRQDRVPDITLPMDLPREWTSPSLTPRQGAEDKNVFGARVLAEGKPGGGGAVESTPSTGPLFPGETAEFNEKPEEVSSIKPVEQNLELDVLAYQPPDERATTYFEIRIKRHGTEALPVVPKDVMFVQDCSESMTPSRLAECKRGLRRCVDLLGPDDRFNIMAFRDVADHCFETWVAPSPAVRAKALAFIDDMRSHGNTDVNASLEAALKADTKPGRPMLVLLISDGRPTTGVTDSSQIIEQFSQANKGRISIFTFGSGKKVNRFLLDLISYRNRGDSQVVPDIETVPEAMEQWAKQLNQPVLTDLSYQFAGLDESQIYPRMPTHLYLDRPLVVVGRVTGKPVNSAFQVIGRSGSELRDMVFPLDLATAKTGTEDIREQWVWQKVYQLMAEYITTGERSYLREIDTLTTRYGLHLPFWTGYSTHDAVPP